MEEIKQKRRVPMRQLTHAAQVAGSWTVKGDTTAEGNAREWTNIKLTGPNGP